MTDSSKDTVSQRRLQYERFVNWAKNSPLANFPKKLLPQKFKNWLKGPMAILDLGDGAYMQYPRNDQYYNHFAEQKGSIRSYEPEIWWIADRYFTPDTIFIDAGANMGLWSCLAAAKIGHKDQVIAVEPSNSVLPILRQNQALNKNRFTIVDKAIWHNSTDTLQFQVDTDHAASSIIGKGWSDSPSSVLKVRTSSVDDLVQTSLSRASRAKKVIIKLDVEGAEEEALEGAKKTLAEQNTLVIYEDHGKDRECKTTAAFLKRGLKIYAIDPVKRTVHAIKDESKILDFKPDNIKGYNFIACRPGSEFDLEFQKLSGTLEEVKATDSSAEHSTVKMGPGSSDEHPILKRESRNWER